MIRHIIKISILVVWAVLLSWHVLEVSSRPLPEKIDAAFLGDYNDYFGIYYGDKKVGWSYKSLRRLEDGSYQAGHATYFEVDVVGYKNSINVDLLLNLDKTLNMKEYQYIFSAGPLSSVERGFVKDGAVHSEVKLNGAAAEALELLSQYKDMLGSYAAVLDITQPKNFTTGKGPLFPGMMPAYMSYSGMEAGRKYVVPMLDPLQRCLTDLDVTVESMLMEYDTDAGRKVPIYKLVFSRDGNVLSYQWVDRYGRTVREKNSFMSINRVEDQNAAVEGISPFSPPLVFQKILEQKNIEEIYNFIIKRSGKK